MRYSRQVASILRRWMFCCGTWRGLGSMKRTRASPIPSKSKRCDLITTSRYSHTHIVVRLPKSQVSESFRPTRVEVPYEVFNYLHTNFLGSLEWRNSVGGIEDPTLWTCDAQLLPQLPRIVIYIDYMVFILDPEDYTYDDKTDSSRFVIEVVSTIFQDDVWILGAPFLRKFPTVFRRTELLITFFCPSSPVSCIKKDSGQDINPKRLDGLDANGSDSTDSTETPWIPIYGDSDYHNTKSEKTPLWKSLVVAYAIGGVLVVVLATFIVVRRLRRPIATPAAMATPEYTALDDDETITVSSDADTIRSIPLAVRVQ